MLLFLGEFFFFFFFFFFKVFIDDHQIFLKVSNLTSIFLVHGTLFVFFFLFSFFLSRIYDIGDVAPSVTSGRSRAVRDDPHVFTVAERVYCDMMMDKVDQSLIVSGESGAGKTEACKRVMTYLTAISRAKSDLEEQKSGETLPGVDNIEEKGVVTDICFCFGSFANHQTYCDDSLTISMFLLFLLGTCIYISFFFFFFYFLFFLWVHSPSLQLVLRCNPFLEAFGNAKTNRNDNSSRFGKFLRLEFMNGRIIGASMKHYLLGSWRSFFCLLGAVYHSNI